jgi:hypothetical protein
LQCLILLLDEIRVLNSQGQCFSSSGFQSFAFSALILFVPSDFQSSRQ